MNEVGVDERGEVVFLILNPSLLLDDTSNHTVEELVMSVLFETSLGDIIVDLETTLCPTLSLNFLKLCKTFSYNFNSFHHVIPQFIAQTGDPTDTGSGGTSIFNQLPRTSKDYQKDPFFVPPTKELGQTTRLRHNQSGILSMAMANGGIGSQFFFTLRGNEESLDYLDGKHVAFGKVVEGLETLDKVNESLLDQQGKPLRDIRIRHVIVLDDPFPDPEGLLVPPDSPTPTSAQLASLRVGEDELLPSDSEDPELLASKRRQDDARAQALTLEMVGDLPFADVAPPENVLFICKLNQVTTSEDLELIFSRFGEILSCEIIRDDKTGDSLQYGFIEFKERDSAEKAFVKMDNVLVDDRRIHVDFSQSVSKLHNSWVYNKTGGRPPPNKHRKRDNNDNDDDDRHDRRGGGGGSRTRGREEDLVFDLDQVDSERRGGGGGGGQRRSGRREEYDPRGPGRGVRDDRTRRGDQDRGSYVGGGGHGRRRDERDRSPRGGNGGGGGYDRRDRERERDRERDRRR